MTQILLADWQILWVEPGPESGCSGAKRRLTLRTAVGGRGLPRRVRLCSFDGQKSDRARAPRSGKISFEFWKEVDGSPQFYIGGQEEYFAYFVAESLSIRRNLQQTCESATQPFLKFSAPLTPSLAQMGGSDVRQGGHYKGSALSPEIAKSGEGGESSG